MFALKYNSATVHIGGLEVRTAGTEMDYSLTPCSALTRGTRFVTRKSGCETATEALQAAKSLASSLGKKVCKNCAAAAQVMADAEAAEIAAQAAAEAEAPAAPAARRVAEGAASATGWELLYDKPKQGCEVGRRVAGGVAQYALICKAHNHVHPVARLTDERATRAAGGWCPSC